MFKNPLRAWPLLVVALILLVVVWTIAPQQLGVLAWKGLVLTAAAWVGYWFDRLTFPYARPHIYMPPPGVAWDQVRANLFVGAQARRAGMIMAAVLAAGLAL